MQQPRGIPINRGILICTAALGRLLLAAGFAAGGAVHTDEGRIIEGTVNLADGQVLVQPPSGRVIRIDAERVLSITFEAEEGGRAAERALPAGWVGRDIGTVGLAGSSRLAGGAFRAAGSGGGIDGKADAFHFLHQVRAGDVQIVARLMRMQNTDERARAGLMIRESDQPGAAHVALLVPPRGMAQMHVRRESGTGTMDRSSAKVDLPVWLKLTRRGHVFAGFWSADGSNWQPIGEQEVVMRPDVLVGVAACSGNNGLLNSTVYQAIELTGPPAAAGRENTVDAARGAARGGAHDAAGARILLNSGLVLRDGTVLTGVVREVTADAVRVTRISAGESSDLVVPLAAVGRIVYRPVTSAMLQQLVPRVPGVLLGNGDFFEGEITAIVGGKLTISSVLHGIRSFTVAQDVAMAVLADPQPPEGAVVVLGRDGTVLIGDRLRIEGSAVVVDHPVLGRMAAGKGQLEQVRALGGRYTWLGAVQPAGGRAAAEALGTLDEGRIVRLPAGGRITWTLDGRYSALLGSLRADERAVPMIASTLVITADGREVYRSGEVTGIDPPAAISLPLAGVKSLTIAVEPGTAGLGPAVDLRDAMLIRAP